jgi:hypothetical protein
MSSCSFATSKAWISRVFLSGLTSAVTVPGVSEMMLASAPTAKGSKSATGYSTKGAKFSRRPQNQTRHLQVCRHDVPQDAERQPERDQGFRAAAGRARNGASGAECPRPAGARGKRRRRQVVHQKLPDAEEKQA